MAASTMHTATDGLGIGIGIGLGVPLLTSVDPDNAKPKLSNAVLGYGHPHLNQQLRWPYSTRYRSSTHMRLGCAYDSSPTPSSSSSESDSSVDAHKTPASATHDVLLSYFSPALSDASQPETLDKVYLLSSGLKNPQTRRSKSETFRFPLPPGKPGSIKAQPVLLKSAMRSTSKDYTLAKPSRAVQSVEGHDRFGTHLSPALQETSQARQGWSPYSSVAPTPRQVSASQRFGLDSSLDVTDSPNSQRMTYTQSLDRSDSAAYACDAWSGSCSSQTLVSDSETDSGAETDPGFSSDAAKLARLHASLLLLDGAVTELPLSLGETGARMGSDERVQLAGSVEEKMAYLCGLGYRYRSAKRDRHARNASGEFASAKVQHAEIGGWWSDDPDNPEHHGVVGVDEREKMRQGNVQSHAPTVVGTHKAVRVVSACASAVTSGDSSPILGGTLAATVHIEQAVDDGDVTMRANLLPEPAAFESLLDDDFSYLVDDRLIDSHDWHEHAAAKWVSAESALMTPPLTTPELGLHGASPALLDAWPSPLCAIKTDATASAAWPRGALQAIDGCRPYSTSSSVDAFEFSAALSRRGTQPTMLLTSSSSCPLSITTPTHSKSTHDSQRHQSDTEQALEIAQVGRTTTWPCSVLTRPRPLACSHSSTSLFSSASSDRLQKPPGSESVLARPRPLALRSADHCSFGSKPDLVAPRKAVVSKIEAAQAAQKLSMPRSASTSTVATQIKVPQRKSSLNMRAQAQLPRLGDQTEEHEPSHPPSRVRWHHDAQYHSSAESYVMSGPFSAPIAQHGYRAPISQAASQVCTSAANSARIRRRRLHESIPQSHSLPVLFTARTPAQRARAEPRLRTNPPTTTSVVSAPHPTENKPSTYTVQPPNHGVLVVQEITTIGLAL